MTLAAFDDRAEVTADSALCSACRELSYAFDQDAVSGQEDVDLDILGVGVHELIELSHEHLDDFLRSFRAVEESTAIFTEDRELLRGVAVPDSDAGGVDSALSQRRRVLGLSLIHI